MNLKRDRKKVLCSRVHMENIFLCVQIATENDFSNSYSKVLKHSFDTFNRRIAIGNCKEVVLLLDSQQQ